MNCMHQFEICASDFGRDIVYAKSFRRQTKTGHKSSPSSYASSVELKVCKSGSIIYHIQLNKPTACIFFQNFENSLDQTQQALVDAS